MSDTEPGYKTHKIEGTDELLMSTIRDQASDLEHGWREAIQNGLDAPGSSRVELEWTVERSVIRDNGEGVELSGEAGRKLLTHLGASSKDRDDDSTIGQFGIGKGQVIAKGRTVMKSGDTQLTFDIEAWGLTVRESELDTPVEGFVVEIDHYLDEVPYEGSYRWNMYEERICDRFKYATLATGKDVVVNGELVSDTEPAKAVSNSGYSMVETFDSPESGPVHFAVAQGSQEPLAIYSRGVFVKEEHGRGLTGVVVTERNLDLNFARNEIKSGCDIMRAIDSRLEELREELFAEVPDDRLIGEAREWSAEQMVAAFKSGEQERFEAFKFRPILRTANESWVSPADVLGKSQIAYSVPGDATADKLIEGFKMTVLDENNGTVEAFRGMLTDMPDEQTPEVFTVEAKAEELGLKKSHVRIDDSALSPFQSKKLLAARELASRMGINRTIEWGESDTAHAWTDGFGYIVLTDSAAPSTVKGAWISQLYLTLVHEAAHTESTKEGCASHGRFFDQKFRELTEETEHVLGDFIEDVERDGMESTFGWAFNRPA